MRIQWTFGVSDERGKVQGIHFSEIQCAIALGMSGTANSTLLHRSTTDVRSGMIATLVISGATFQAGGDEWHMSTVCVSQRLFHATICCVDGRNLPRCHPDREAAMVNQGQ